MFEAYNKSFPLSSVCVRLCRAETAHVRELNVILMLVLCRHECVRGKCYININKLVFSKSVDEVADTDLPSHLINASTDYDYNERVFVFYILTFNE